MKKNKIIESIKKNYRILVIILFVILLLIIGSKHEPWADEAQAWLLARDTTLYSLFIKYLHAEGHPALWYIILKIFQSCGLKFEYLYIVPIIFSSIGVYLFVFKSKFPWYIKCLFPFTFFIFYQYTIVARSYCLIFPLISLLAVIWKDRYNKIELFSLILILLINCETHTYLFAGSVYFYCLLETFIDLRKGIKKNKKVYTYFVLLFLAFFFTMLYVLPTNSTHIPIQFKYYIISDSFFTKDKSNNLIKLIASLLILIYMCLFIFKDKKNIVKFFLFIIPIIIFMDVVHIREWHFGIITIIFIFTLWIDNLENNLFVKIFLICLFFVQIPWTFKSSLDDFRYSYSTTKDVADFIKKYDYENIKIVNSNFYAVSVNAYFDYNIFDNWNDDLGFFYFDKSNEFFSKFYSIDSFLDNNIDIYILYSLDEEKMSDSIINDYNKYSFDNGNIFFEGLKHMNQSFLVYVKKDIDKIKEES